MIKSGLVVPIHLTVQSGAVCRQAHRDKQGCLQHPTLRPAVWPERSWDAGRPATSWPGC